MTSENLAHHIPDLYNNDSDLTITDDAPKEEVEVQEDRGGGNGSHDKLELTTIPDMLTDFVVNQPPPKKRGRLKGSNNNNKPEVTDIYKSEVRQIAENSADPNFENSFIDSGDICEICHFTLNDPVKRLKSKTNCPKCCKLVHKPCLKKSGTLLNF